MRNNTDIRFLFLILTLFLGFIACSRQDACEEKMLAIEGIYWPESNAFQIEDDPFNGRIMKAGDHWVFSYILTISPDNGPKFTHQFEQQVIWSPELNAYLFDHLSESDYELLKADYVVVQYQTRLERIVMKRMSQGNDGPRVLNSYSWSRL